MIYLQIEQLISNLSLGKPVEQWLGTYDHKDYVEIRWLRICQEKPGSYSVYYLQVFDEGDHNFTGIYEFGAIDTDEPYGKIDCFSSYQEALEFSVKRYGSKLDAFVCGGLIEAEYIDYLKSRTSR